MHTEVSPRDEALHSLIVPAETRIVFLIMDGLGGLPIERGGPTELEAARTPNLDTLAREAALGLHEPLGAGMTPGSGPAHLALFGYDPFHYVVGRGILGALGIDFPIQHGDVAARLNFATADAAGNITDRRAGRLATEINERLTRMLEQELRPPSGVTCFVRTDKEYRGLLVLRGDGLSGDIDDTDPQVTGVPPHAPHARSAAAERTAGIVATLVEQAFRILASEKQANRILLRGFDTFHAIPTLRERFGLAALGIASYPMYRGLARLVGMEVHAHTDTVPQELDGLTARWREFDFHYVHVKATDSRGEDGDFAAKVRVIEEVDALIPRIMALRPDVLLVTGDHSTPAAHRAHSWHPVPFLLHADRVRTTPVDTFGEAACLRGSLGIRPATDLMPLALAHAGRLIKYGA